MISEKKLALMQGRLTKPIRKPIQEFPIENWENEIGLLNKLNFKAIEWIIDLYSYEKNPILASRDLVDDILNKNKKFQINFNYKNRKYSILSSQGEYCINIAIISFLFIKDQIITYDINIKAIMIPGIIPAINNFAIDSCTATP